MNWQTPSEAEILKTVDATWPAARYIKNGPFTLRRGDGGGQRVSAASAGGRVNAAQISAAETAMRALGQQRLFMIASGDAALDHALAARGYRQKDPVTMFAAPVAALARYDTGGLTTSFTDAPLAVMKDIWQAGGIGTGRLAVMARAAGPKTMLLGRMNDAAVGAGYVAMHNNSAILHALEVLPNVRRKGLGLAMTAAAAAWAKAQGATSFTLLAVSANTAACGLYRHLGMVEAGNYHYRLKD